MHNILTGQMGVSISRFPTPVTEVIASQIGWTLLLGGTALVCAAVVGNLLGILAAWRRAARSTRPFPRFWSSLDPSRTSGWRWSPVPVRRRAGLVPDPPRVHRWTEPAFTSEFIGDVGAHLPRCRR